MEEEENENEKYRQISQQEAKDIDSNKVSYYTLLDGTVVYVKKDGEPGEGSPVQGNEPLKKDDQEFLQNNTNSAEAQVQGQNDPNIDQNNDIYASESNQINQQQNTLSSQEMQDQGQIQTQSQNQQILSGSENENVQLNTEINTDTTNVIQSQSQNRIKNNQEILQPGDNFAYSSIRMQNKTQQKPQAQMCPSCNYKFPLQNGPGQFVNFNAKLIEARPYGFNGQLYKLQNSQNYYQSQTQMLPRRRQLYKLIEAVPIKVSGMNLVNRNTNTKLNLVNSNSYTYLVENTQKNTNINTNINRSTFNSNQYQTYTQTQRRTTQRPPYNTLTQTKSNTRAHRVYVPRFDYQEQFMEDEYNQYPQPVSMGRQGQYIQRNEYAPNIQPQYDNYEEYPNEYGYDQYAQFQEQEYQKEGEEEDNNYYANANQVPNQYLLHQQYLRQYQDQERYGEPPEEYQNEEQYQNGEQENNRIQYCTCDRSPRESNQEQEKPIKYCCCGKNDSECICPIGNTEIRKDFEIADPNSASNQNQNEES